MPITQAVIATLSDEDLKTIVDVYDMTSQGDEHGIVIVKGPETAHLFEPRNGKPRWQSVQPLGVQINVFNKSHAAANATGRPHKQTRRRIERMFVNSLEWPNGIPVDAFDEFSAVSMEGGEFKFTNTHYGISSREMDRLASMANGYLRRSPREELKLERQRERVRMQAEDPNTNALASILNKALAQQAAEDEAPKPQRKRRSRKAAKPAPAPVTAEVEE